MGSAANSFSMFFDNEETEDPTEIAIQLKIKAVRDAEEAMMVEALIMDEEWTRQQKKLEEKKVERDSQGRPKRRQNKKAMYRQKGQQSTASNANGRFQGQSRPSSQVRSRPSSQVQSRPSSQDQSRPSSAHSQQAQTQGLDNANNGTVVESAKLSNDVANDVTEEKAETKEQRKARLEAERNAKEKQAEWERKRIDREIEAKQMTLEKYEKSVLLAKRKALEDKTKNVEERKVTLDQAFENMHLIGKKEEESLSIKQVAEREKISKLKKKEDKAKTINISEFRKLYSAETSQGAPNGGLDRVGHGLSRVGHGLGRGAFNANLKNGVKPHEDGAYRKPIASPNNGNYQNARGGYQKEAPRRDGAYKKPMNNQNNNGSMYQKNEPATKSVKLPAKSAGPPSINDTEQFPGLLKH